MLFPTVSFGVFFLCVFIGFWYVFRRSAERRAFLVAASYLFYAFWDWRFCFLLLVSTAASWGFGLLIGREKEHFWRRLFLVLSVVFNLLLLGFFKYYNFFAESANALIGYFAHGSAAAASPSQAGGFLFPALAIIMPVGISFYTFKSMSYVFDVYLCELPAVRSFLDVALYVSFFPQIASGPIVHAVDFIPQIEQATSLGAEPGSKPIEAARAFELFMSGLLKKMVFANFLSTLFVDPVLSDPSAYNAIEVALAAVGYSVVIYSDFSGYSDMAIAVALLLGFKTPANFNRPYASFSVTEFWKRWHITFSSWLRNYLYFSMGGSRFGKVRTLFALFFTMVLGGLWHGAALTFVAWGVMQGLALAIERGFGYGNARHANAFVAAIQIALTFAFVTLSWIVFRAPSLDSVLAWFQALGNFSKGITLLSPLVIALLVAGLAMHAVPERVRSSCRSAWVTLPVVARGGAIAAFFALLAVVSMSGVAPFIYFQF
jgi:D-alanyl-lipoteichoic acid acyltransferase DltB (MBOAT superfamily)